MCSSVFSLIDEFGKNLSSKDREEIVECLPPERSKREMEKS
jgi:hypothetical protein